MSSRSVWIHLAALSTGGVVAAHAVSYALVHPDPHARNAALHLSGHGYWDVAVAGTVVFVLGAVLAWIGGAFLAARNATGEPTALRTLWVRLAPMQVGLFLVGEVAERIVSGSLGSLGSELAVWLGLPVLLVVALVGALVLRVAEHAGIAVARRMRRPPAHTTIVPSPLGRDSAIPSTLLGRVCRTRAPPVPVAS